MKRSFHVSYIVFHPATLAVFSGVFAAVIGFLINLVSGGNSSQSIWIALSFAIVLSLALNAWQMFVQEKSGQQMMTLLQEMVLQTYFLTVLADKPEISRMAQQRLSQVMTALNAEQQVSMLKFFSTNGLPATFVGNALQASTSLQGADLHQIALPHIHLKQAYLNRANLSGANLSGANLQEASLYQANLSGANLYQANLSGANLYQTNLSGANLCQANLSGANLCRANFKSAELSAANLQGANLTSADLTEANLQGADLTEATLSEALLDGADVRTAKVTEEQLQMVRTSLNMKREP
ncbi:MAG: pentapeptide repeat-containing protein [Ktedonobacteraceae bacterium]